MDYYNNMEESPFDRTVHELERQCKRLAEPIINRLGWRIIKEMGKQMANTEIDEDMADLGLSFFDQLSIYYQNRSYEEIMFGFDDYVDDSVQAAINGLTETERLILEHRSIYLLSEGKMEDKIFMDVKNELSSIIDEHYYTSRVQRFVDRYDLRG
ncbi:MAG: hypothetical protein IJV27_05710 [Prevotella sp.]|nr:hypothetical protein [Prevotella sp.]